MHAVKSRGQLDILRRNADLTQFVIEGDFTGRKLGSGFFGSVEEVLRYFHCHFLPVSIPVKLNRLLSKALYVPGKESSTLQITIQSSGTLLKCI